MEEPKNSNEFGISLQKTKDMCFKVRGLCMNESLSDIFLKVHDEEEKCEAEVPVHKFILGVQSEVFAKILYTPEARKTGKILLPDVSLNGLKICLKILYQHSIDLQSFSLENLFQALFCAKKYDLVTCYPMLEEYLLSELSPSTAFLVLEQSNKLTLGNIKKQCLDFIAAAIDILLHIHRPEFNKLSEECVLEILKRDDLRTREFHLIKACHEYSTMQCEQSACFSRFCPYLGFPLLKFPEFAYMISREYLSEEQIVQVMQAVQDIGKITYPYEVVKNGSKLKLCTVDMANPRNRLTGCFENLPDSLWKHIYCQDISFSESESHEETHIARAMERLDRIEVDANCSKTKFRVKSRKFERKQSNAHFALICHKSDDKTELLRVFKKQGLQNMKILDSVSSVHELLVFDSVLVWGFGWSDVIRHQYGNILARYMDRGGNVVVTCVDTESGLAGNFLGYVPIRPGTTRTNAQPHALKYQKERRKSESEIKIQEALMDGVSSFRIQRNTLRLSSSKPIGGGETVLQYDDNEPLVCFRRIGLSTIVQLNFDHESSMSDPIGGWDVRTDGFKLMANSLKFTCCRS